jgi:small subunit ribosomal protein S17e
VLYARRAKHESLQDLLRSLGMDSIPVNVVAVGASEPQQRKRFVPGAGAA